MLQKLFPKHFKRYLASPAAETLQDVAVWLLCTGYSRDCAQAHLYRLKRVLECAHPFDHRAALTEGRLSELFIGFNDDALFLATQRAFRRFLIAQGRYLAEPRPDPFVPLLERYRQRLLELGGFSPLTARQHLATVTDFLASSVPPSKPLAQLRSSAVERYIEAKGKHLGRQTLQHTVAHLRRFLRFCHEIGETPERLDRIDTPRAYRDEQPPRALDWAMVQRLLRSVDRSDMAGWRDYTVLYLMAHYGLRPSELVSLTLDSIDWAAKRLRVEQSKTHSTLALPLTEQALRVLRRYLANGRPPGQCRSLFLRLRCPAGPIERTAVTDLYAKRVKLSGLPIGHSSPYSLRHSFAMRLLERGVSVKAIGDLLGHHCVFHAIPDSDSTVKRTAIPEQGGH